LKNGLVVFSLLLNFSAIFGQGITQGGLAGGVFGVNGSVIAGEIYPSGFLPPAGTVDWFKLSTGTNVINQTSTSTIYDLLKDGNGINNPAYIRRLDGGILSKVSTVDPKVYRINIDAVWARDNFGGSGGLDTTAFVVSSKNGQDPAFWYPGIGNVLGKNDLIDIGGHMFRAIDSSGTNTKNNLWFIGFINRAEPGGSAYMDFEFFIKDVGYNKTMSKFPTGGPDRGHTSFKFDGSGNITQLGDMIYNFALSGGGTTPGVEVRIWVSRTDFNTKKPNPYFTWGNLFDGDGTNATYGYAAISPRTSGAQFGYINAAGQTPSTPPWGSRNTKENKYVTTYSAYSASELGLNLTAFGLDNYLYLPPNGSYDKCTFPWKTFIIKTRSSVSFTAALKDFVGSYQWGTPTLAVTSANPVLSCSNVTATLSADPLYEGASYAWSTLDGNIIGTSTGTTVVVDKPGSYSLSITRADGCVMSSNYPVTYDYNNPQITGVNATVVPACNGGSTGQISLTVAGGTPSFSYVWSNGSTSGSLTGLTAGNYTVTLTDSKGCTFTSSAINVPATNLTVTATKTDVLCFGQTTGSIDITPSGGVGAYTYSWSNGKTVQDLTNIGKGTYTVTVTDSKGCAKTESYTVGGPTAALSATLTKTDDTNPASGTGDGTASLTVSGGTTPYTFNWDGPGTYSSTLEDLTSLDYGSYVVTITDANGCAITKSTFIYEPEVCSDNIDNDGDGLVSCDDPDCKSTVTIAGDDNPCITDNVTYTATSSSTISFYEWTLPTNTSLVSTTVTTTTNTISFSWTSTAAGQVCVRASNGSCYSEKACMTVSPKQKPPKPITIQKN